MNTDDIGDRGQCLFHLLTTQLCPGRMDPYFRPRFLGEKFPTFDYLVELVGHEEWFFFVQVKTTERGCATVNGERRLRVKVENHDVDRMVKSPIPAYVVGIDEKQQVGYVLSANEPIKIASLKTSHPLDYRTLNRLWHEVRNFWVGRDMTMSPSYFV